jgi:hypothetical protein
MKVIISKKWGAYPKGSDIEILDKAVLRAGFKIGLFEKNKDNKKAVDELFKGEPIEVIKTPEVQEIEFVNEKTEEKTKE